MAIHKLSQAFFGSLEIEWPCPACGQLTLQIKKETLHQADSYGSQQLWKEEWSEPEMLSGVFCCMAECYRPQCGEVVVCSGTSGNERDWEGETGDQYYTFYSPVSFVPPLKPFIINEKCPDEISKPLVASFSVYLAQPGSAANLIRITVERLLTAIGVPELNDKGRRIILHERLERHLPGNYADYAGPLMAIKFLGNAGSHTYDEVKISDIEDAFEIMEYVVSDIFSERKESIEVLTRRLNDRFGKKE
jgi:hypothetical protein